MTNILDFEKGVPARGTSQILRERSVGVGISLGNQRKATFDKLKDLRDRMRAYGPLDQITPREDEPSATDEEVLLHMDHNTTRSKTQAASFMCIWMNPSIFI